MDYQMEFGHLLEQEQACTFRSFNKIDAFELGCAIIREAVKTFPGVPVGCEIELNGLLVFRCYLDGISRDNELWLRRKRNTVNAKEMSTQRFQMLSRVEGKELADWLLDPQEYAYWAGGFPVLVEGCGMIGTIGVTGLPGTGDHDVIVATIRQYQDK